jgi:hypothetical protein
MPEETKGPAKPKAKPRRLLNPRRVQSLLKRAHEVLLLDSKDPKMTVQERVSLLKSGSEYIKALGAADGRRRRDEKSKREAAKKLGPLD